ncbi:hypothetical protein [Sphingomonas faeni]|uniref:hypothetical protein n=1 Tax=Sphingomonas faeni TaxID=185950 RepID=UPI0033541B8B
MLKLSAGERRALANKGRQSETRQDIAARFLSRVDGRLMATFPKHFGVISKGPIDITHLDGHPGLRDAFAFGYVMHCLGVEAADRRYYIDQTIKSGFLRFLRETSIVGLDIGDITEQTLKDFKVWLDDENSVGWAPSEITRKIRIQDIQLILKQLMADKEWSARLSPDLKLLENIYRDSHRSINHTEILDDASLELLFVSCAAACEEVMGRREKTEKLLKAVIEAGDAVTPAGIRGDVIRCAAFLLAGFGDRPPSYETITRKVSYGKAISETLYEDALDILFPNIDELLPFVLILTILFAFNPGVVLNMTHSDYEDDWFAGRQRIRLFPYKPRKHGRHRNSVVVTDDYDNPHRLLKFLESRTERVRRIVRRPAFADRVFIRYSRGVGYGIPLEMSDKAWREALKRFCAKHGLDYFTLKQIRPTTLDLVHELTGGNLMATQQVAGHESPDTTKEFYESAAMQRRDEEMLAGGINQWWRFLETGGIVDATERDRLNVDLGAATPGFGCADPYDSPVRGERKGALCTAYGRCPMCEFALVDLTSPHAYRYHIELLRRIDEAMTTLGEAWLWRWGPVKQRLLIIGNKFPLDVRLAAGSVSIPPLPEVD